MASKSATKGRKFSFIFVNRLETFTNISHFKKYFVNFSIPFTAHPTKTKCCSKNSKTIHSLSKCNATAKARTNSKRRLFQDVRLPLPQPFQMSSFREVCFIDKSSARLQTSSFVFVLFFFSFSRFMCIWIHKIFPSLRSWWNYFMRLNSHNGKTYTFYILSLSDIQLTSINRSSH